MVSLNIDTRDNQKVVARLTKDKEMFEAVSTAENRHPESILKLIEQVCEKASVKLDSIDEINVEEGPGSYTGLKVGASVANALGFALQKKVNGKKLGEIIEPKYE